MIDPQVIVQLGNEVDELRTDITRLRSQRDRLAAILHKSYYEGTFHTADAAEILAEIEGSGNDPLS